MGDVRPDGDGSRRFWPSVGTVRAFVSLSVAFVVGIATAAVWVRWQTVSQMNTTKQLEKLRGDFYEHKREADSTKVEIIATQEAIRNMIKDLVKELVSKEKAQEIIENSEKTEKRLKERFRKNDGGEK